MKYMQLTLHGGGSFVVPLSRIGEAITAELEDIQLGDQITFSFELVEMDEEEYENLTEGEGERMDNLNKCLEQIVKEGQATKMQALLAPHRTKYFRAAQRRFNAQIQTDSWREAGDDLIKLAVRLCSTPESERDSLFTPEELCEQ